ncbi:helix-turn-helix domain-containing protein [Burkholderia multivorans]|uniref:helix-turn-helix domain-containing protein n=1 Tax=Burkholderia multivorans TaxID=87883 RepID=UPI0012DD1939|nr:helix-turn-helix domain-containing protein [Burkholderia multivorans]MBU9233214.1 helix-turn-helix domain-containing protein [Burkholderia multivorans]QGR95074.1 helix-turn-helix domain-containing protein [Burkholderia multivorans]HEF4739711.1 helix-turn-helix domain-containing protein [Burkholderia multivorans]
MNARYITPQQVSERYGNRISVRTLANWRWAGTGPRFCRVGGRILYNVDDLAEWEQRRTVASTGEYHR